jgi:hypothetical protein
VNHRYVADPAIAQEPEAVRELYAEGHNGRMGPNSAGRIGEGGFKRVQGARGPDGRHKTSVLGQDGSIQHRDGERWPNGGRNIRSVWEIATQPYPEAHFATFPEELARRCIAAGTSERGKCPECGAPWVREVEREGIDVPRGNEPHLRRDPGNTLDRDIPTHYKPKITLLGWKPSCSCGALLTTGAFGESFGSARCKIVALQYRCKNALLRERVP